VNWLAKAELLGWKESSCTKSLTTHELKRELFEQKKYSPGKLTPYTTAYILACYFKLGINFILTV
jgi:hypothetical protein